jgi:hypothetical protein
MPARGSRTTSTRSVDRVEDETGSGLLGSVVGVTVFLVLLLFAVQLAMNLYATSVVTTVTFDAARKVAGSAHGSTTQAEADARTLLRGFDAASLRFTWGGNADVVTLHVVARRPTSLLPNVSFPFATVDRMVRVRREQPR